MPIRGHWGLRGLCSGYEGYDTLVNNCIESSILVMSRIAAQHPQCPQYPRLAD